MSSKIFDEFKEKFSNDEEANFKIHAKNILAKINKKEKIDVVENVIVEYLKFVESNTIKGYTKEIVEKRVKALNRYFNFFKEKNYDNIFTSQ